MAKFIINIEDQAQLDGITSARNRDANSIVPLKLSSDTDEAFLAAVVSRMVAGWAAEKVSMDRATAIVLAEKGDFTMIDKLVADAKAAQRAK